MTSTVPLDFEEGNQDIMAEVKATTKKKLLFALTLVIGLVDFGTDTWMAFTLPSDPCFAARTAMPPYNATKMLDFSSIFIALAYASAAFGLVFNVFVPVGLFIAARNKGNKYGALSELLQQKDATSAKYKSIHTILTVLGLLLEDAVQTVIGLFLMIWFAGQRNIPVALSLFVSIFSLMIKLPKNSHDVVRGGGKRKGAKNAKRNSRICMVIVALPLAALGGYMLYAVIYTSSAVQLPFVSDMAFNFTVRSQVEAGRENYTVNASIYSVAGERPVYTPIFITSNSTMLNKVYDWKSTKCIHDVAVRDSIFGGAPYSSYWARDLDYLACFSKYCIENDNDLLLIQFGGVSAENPNIPVYGAAMYACDGKTKIPRGTTNVPSLKVNLASGKGDDIDIQSLEFGSVTEFGKRARLMFIGIVATPQDIQKYGIRNNGVSYTESTHIVVDFSLNKIVNTDPCHGK